MEQYVMATGMPLCLLPNWILSLWYSINSCLLIVLEMSVMLEKHLLSHVEVGVVCTVHDVKLTVCSFKHITLNTYYVTNNLFSYRFMAYENLLRY